MEINDKAWPCSAKIKSVKTYLGENTIIVEMEPFIFDDEVEYELAVEMIELLGWDKVS